MKIKNLIGILAVSLLLISLVSAATFKSLDLFTSDSSSSADAKTFLNRPLVMQIQDSGIMVACYDFNNEYCNENPIYDKCFADNQQDFDKCIAYDSWLSGKYTQGSPEAQLMPVISSLSTCADARYYKNCDGAGGGSLYLVTQKQYDIYSRRQYDCDNGIPSWYTYDAEGYIKLNYYLSPDYYDYKDEIGCPSGYRCSSYFDRQPVGSYNEIIDPACKKDKWASCSEDFECYKKKCIDGKCSPCRSDECTHATYQECVDNSMLDNTSQQYYCKYDETFAECTASYHVGCQKQGNYYCTYQDAVWKWRGCEQGCSNNACVVPGVASMSVTPILLKIII